MSNKHPFTQQIENAVKKEKGYEFHLSLFGFGKTTFEAWQNAIDAFAMDPGPVPAKHHKICTECLNKLTKCDCKT